jgi:hypothetical protein
MEEVLEVVIEEGWKSRAPLSEIYNTIRRTSGVVDGGHKNMA